MGTGGTLFLEARERIGAGGEHATGFQTPWPGLPEMMSGPPTPKWRRTAAALSVRRYRSWGMTQDA